MGKVPAAVAALIICMSGSGASAADATCPTQADLGAGIRVDYADGSSVRYRTGDGGNVEITEVPDDGDAVLLQSRHGLYDLSAFSAPAAGGEPAPVEMTEYDLAPDDLPLPEPATAWTGRVTISTPDGRRETMTVVYVFGAPETAEIGGCSYPSVNVKASFLGEGGWIWQEFTYFLDLGFGTLTASQFEGDEMPLRSEPVALALAAAP